MPNKDADYNGQPAPNSQSGGAGDDDVTGDGTPPGDAEKTFTQADVDKIVKERISREKKKAMDRDKELQATYTRLKEETQMSTEEKEKLQARIEELEEAQMSKDEIAERRVRQAEAAREREVKEAKEERNRHRDLLIDNLKDQALTAAAAKLKAFDAAQVVRMLKGDVEVEEIVSEVTGKPSGKFKLSVSVDVTDDEGTHTESFSIDDGVKAFLENNPNLLSDNFNGGGGTKKVTLGPDGKPMRNEADIANMPEAEFQSQLGEIFEDMAKGRIRRM